jgi:hypothetical protein
MFKTKAHRRMAEMATGLKTFEEIRDEIKRESKPRKPQ